MNILFIAYGFTPQKGGVQRVTDILTKEFIKRGHNVFYYCGRSIEGAGEYNLATTIFYSNSKLSESFTKADIDSYKQILKDKKIDVIINQYPLHKRGDILLKNTYEGVLKISFYHGNPFPNNIAGRSIVTRLHRFIAKFRFRKRLRQISEMSDYLGFLCSAYVDSIRKEHLIKDSTNLFYIPNPNTFPVVSKIENKGNYILFVGRVSDPVKNIDDFIKVWELLYLSFPAWTALIIGDDSKCIKQKEYIAENHIERISFLGFQNDVRKYYSMAKIICITSKHEGWPLVLTESMSMGCVPFSYTTFPSVYEIIDDQKNGVLCTPYNPSDMASKISYYIHNPNLLSKLSVNARKKVSKFAIDKVADKWLLLFNKNIK